MMSRTAQRLLIALLIGLALFTLVGFLVLPAVLLRVAHAQLERHATLPARIAQLEINPFTLELTARGLRLGTEEDPQLLVERLYADLAWDSLWRGALHVERAEIAQPAVQLTVDKTGTLSAVRWFEVSPGPEKQPSDGNLFPVRVDAFQLTGGRLSLRDERLGEPPTLTVDDLSLAVNHLSTLPDEEADARLSAQGPAGSTLRWQGRLGLAPIRSSGELEITQLQLAPFAPYLRQILPLALESGQLAASTQYRLSMGERLDFSLSQAQASLQQLVLSQADGKPLLRLAELAVSDTVLNPGTRQVRIGQLRSQGLEGWASREADGRLSLQALRPPPDDTPEQAPETAARASDWRVVLDEAQVSDYRVHLTDRVPNEPVELTIGPLAATVRDLDTGGESPFQASLETGIGLHGQLEAKGQVSLAPVSATLSVQAQDLDLRLAQAYLAPYLHLELRSGLLSSDLQLALTATEPLAFRATGEARVTQLHARDSVKNRDLLRWRQLDVQGLTYEHGQRLEITTVNLDQPYARFIIYPNLTTNIGDLLVDKPALATSDNTPDKPPLAIQIGQVTLNGGSGHFADLSLRPNFVTDIQDLDGRVSTLSNRAKAPASLKFAGKVDRYAPVTIEGQLDPFDPLERLDVAARFANVELTTLTPYAAKFAGYRIRKGRMNLALHYRISQGQLKAEHDVVIEELQLGERVESDKAVDLPVRLAVALLKDSSGTIRLDIPVEGDLDNPQFEVMPLIWKTLRNLIAKAATSPFKALGRLVSAGDTDLSQVQFAPGTTTLSDTAMADLERLAEALRQRPELRLEVEGAASAPLDGPLVAEQRLEQALRSLHYQELQRRGERVPASASQLDIADELRPALIERLYHRRIGETPEAWAELPQDKRTQQMRQALLERWANSELWLRRLGQARAARIKDYLVDQGGLDDQRVFLLDTQLTETTDGLVASQLHLGAE